MDLVTSVKLSRELASFIAHCPDKTLTDTILRSIIVTIAEEIKEAAGANQFELNHDLWMLQELPVLEGKKFVAYGDTVENDDIWAAVLRPKKRKPRRASRIGTKSSAAAG